jgi:hypothetical protein
VAVEPHTFDLPVHLIRDRVVSKHDWFASIRGGRIVSESAEVRRLNAARKASATAVRQTLHCGSADIS